MTKLPWHNAPRQQLGHLPTPLELLPRLTAELGGPRIWVKRDDCTGLAFGGNKTRKLEYLTGAAVAAGADTLLTFGAVQSNHARQTAAAAAKLGFDCHLILSRTVARQDAAYERGGNVLLDRLLGATLHLVAPHEAGEAAESVKAQLAAAGKTVYQIPAGGSNAVGALGYAACAEELVAQCSAQDIELSHIVHASSSAGTQAGLLWGLGHLQVQPDVMGVNVYHPDPAVLRQRIERLLDALQASAAAPDLPEVHVNHAYFGDGYGQPTAECMEAIRAAAALEGLLFDPVYSGKALAALIDQINLDNFTGARDVILIHTGGTPALHVYEQVAPRQ